MYEILVKQPLLMGWRGSFVFNVALIWGIFDGLQCVTDFVLRWAASCELAGDSYLLTYLSLFNWVSSFKGRRVVVDNGVLWLYFNKDHAVSRHCHMKGCVLQWSSRCCWLQFKTWSVTGELDCLAVKLHTSVLSLSSYLNRRTRMLI